MCKNWTIYNDCYFKTDCSFAHGEHELRQSAQSTEKYKTKTCKMFDENFYCNYGNRCIYLHIIKYILFIFNNFRVGRFFNYNNILKKTVEEFHFEVNKPENHKKDLWRVLNSVKLRKQYIM